MQINCLKSVKKGWWGYTLWILRERKIAVHEAANKKIEI